jgi:uncharacterized Tic20 family protein
MEKIKKDVKPAISRKFVKRSIVSAFIFSTVSMILSGINISLKEIQIGKAEFAVGVICFLTICCILLLWHFFFRHLVIRIIRPVQQGGAKAD